MTNEELIAQLIADMRRNQLMADQSPSLLDQQRDFADMPMATPMSREFIGDRVMQQDPSMLSSQLGAPMFMGSGDAKGTVQFDGAGGTMGSDGMRGYAGGGRLGVNIPITEQLSDAAKFMGAEERDKYLLSLGLIGGGANVKYGMGTPYEGKSDMWKVQGIDAVLRDLARNQEFGAAVSRNIKNDPFYSLYYRKTF
jgi:hypothetical protein